MRSLDHGERMAGRPEAAELARQLSRLYCGVLTNTFSNGTGCNCHLALARTALNGAIGCRLSPLARCRFTLFPLSPLPVCSLHSLLLGRAHPFLRRLINHFQFRPALQPPTLEYNCSRNNSGSGLIDLSFL